MLVMVGAVTLLAAQAGLESRTLEKEAALGRFLADKVRQETTQIESAGIRQYLDRLAARLGAAMPEAGLAFTITAIREDRCPDTHEPVALPGGYVFVSAGLFAAADTEQEFAAMVAHAMAEVVLRRGRPKPPLGQPANSGATPLIYWAGTCDSVTPLGVRASLRDLEREADAVAVRTLARAGLDPGALLRFLERTPALPERESRLAALRAILAQQSLPGRIAGGGVEFAAVRQAVEEYAGTRPVRQPSLLRKQ